MFQRILVPLDGSLCAELALPTAVRLAQATGGVLIFMRVITLPADAGWYALEPPFRTQELLAAQRRQASTYLAIKAWEIELAGITVQRVVTAGMPVPELLAFIEHMKIDLVVMGSRGETNTRRGRMGSVALRVLQQSSVPVLLLREPPHLSSHLPNHPIHLLALVTGGDRAEAILAPASCLATALSPQQRSSLHLIRLLGPPEARGKSHVQFRDELQARVQQKRMPGWCPTTTLPHLSLATEVVPLSDAATTALRLIKEGPPREEKLETQGIYDAIVLTRQGPQHPYIGSIVQRLLVSTHQPLLVLPPHESCSPSLETSAL